MKSSFTSFARKSVLALALTTLTLAAHSATPGAPVTLADGVLTGPCATNWPPLMAANSDQASGDFSIVTRDDGAKQWALKGKPLYFWSKDSKPGDKTGDGFNKVWQAAKP
jgi:hypothetical protein